MRASHCAQDERKPSANGKPLAAWSARADGKANFDNLARWGSLRTKTLSTSKRSEGAERAGATREKVEKVARVAVLPARYVGCQ